MTSPAISPYWRPCPGRDNCLCREKQDRSPFYQQKPLLICDLRSERVALRARLRKGWVRPVMFLAEPDGAQK